MRHKPESAFQRQKETHPTLRIMFKCPARPKSNRVAVKAHASYVPNHLREAFLRVQEGLKPIGKSADNRMTKHDIHTILALHAIRNALSFTPDPDTHTATLNR